MLLALNISRESSESGGSFGCELHLGAYPKARYQLSEPRLSRSSYLNRLRANVFALAPSGNNPETFRHWEALLQGAIPIAVKPHVDRSYLEVWCNRGNRGFNGNHSHPAVSSSFTSSSRDEVEVKQADLAEPEKHGIEDEGGGDCPVVVLESWDLLPAFLARFSVNAEHPQVVSSEMADVVDRMQRRALEWLHSFVNSTAHEVSELIEQRA